MAPPYQQPGTNRETCAGIFTAQKTTVEFTASLAMSSETPCCETVA